jgi:uncharacterized protein YjbI with pentapeptide repeats
MENPDSTISEAEIRRLRAFLRAVEEHRVVEPGGKLEGNPVILHELAFPEVQQQSLLEISDLDTKRLIGQKRFENVIFRDVDFSRSRLDSSVWSKCRFERVIFDRVSLQGSRFFGCNFVDCSFRATNFSNAALSPEMDGVECSLEACRFQKARFVGTSWSNPIISNSEFAECRFGKSVFDGAEFRSTRFSGTYEELCFRGIPDTPERNRLELDLTHADVTWLHANHGVDLTALRLPPNAVVIKHRKNSIPIISRRLLSDCREARIVAGMLVALFTDKSISPLSNSQDSIFISARMIMELDEALSEERSLEVFRKLCKIAEEEFVVI